MKLKKKPIIIGAIILLCIISFILYPPDLSQDTNKTVVEEAKEVAEEEGEQKAESEETTEPTTETVVKTTESKKIGFAGRTYEKYLAKTVGLTKPRSVRHDNTGNWRISMCASSEDIEDYAVKYYLTYFESDDEIHAVINVSWNKTYKLTVLDKNTLQVDTYDYVKGEEHDAEELFSGYCYDPRWFSIKTGKKKDL